MYVCMYVCMYVVLGERYLRVFRKRQDLVYIQ